MTTHTPSRRAKGFWQKLSQWYGARLAENYGPTPPPDWCEVIDRANPGELKASLTTIRHNHPHHPPTLPEFEAAFPKRREGGRRATTDAERLCLHAARRLTHELCAHQLIGPWNYFGPVEEFASKHRGGEVLRHPRPNGVQIPACSKCSKPSHRALLEDVERAEDGSTENR